MSSSEDSEDESEMFVVLAPPNQFPLPELSQFPSRRRSVALLHAEWQRRAALSDARTFLYPRDFYPSGSITDAIIRKNFFQDYVLKYILKERDRPQRESPYGLDAVFKIHALSLWQDFLNQKIYIDLVMQQCQLFDKVFVIVDANIELLDELSQLVVEYFLLNLETMNFKLHFITPSSTEYRPPSSTPCKSIFKRWLKPIIDGPLTRSKEVYFQAAFRRRRPRILVNLNYVRFPEEWTSALHLAGRGSHMELWLVSDPAKAYLRLKSAITLKTFRPIVGAEYSHALRRFIAKCATEHSATSPDDVQLTKYLTALEAELYPLYSEQCLRVSDWLRNHEVRALGVADILDSTNAVLLGAAKATKGVTTFSLPHSNLPSNEISANLVDQRYQFVSNRFYERPLNLQPEVLVSRSLFVGEQIRPQEDRTIWESELKFGLLMSSDHVGLTLGAQTLAEPEVIAWVVEQLKAWSESCSHIPWSLLIRAKTIFSTPAFLKSMLTRTNQSWSSTVKIDFHDVNKTIGNFFTEVDVIVNVGNYGSGEFEAICRYTPVLSIKQVNNDQGVPSAAVLQESRDFRKYFGDIGLGPRPTVAKVRDELKRIATEQRNIIVTRDLINSQLNANPTKAFSQFLQGISAV